MRVCFVLTRYHPIFSGHALQLEQIFTRLKERGVVPDVWTLRHDDSPVREERNGISIRRFGPVGEARLRRHARTLHLMVAVLVEGRRYSLLHFGGIDSTTRWALLPAVLTGLKRVLQMTLLSVDDPETLLRQRPERLFHCLYRRVHRWIALGTALRDAYRRTDLSPGRLAVIPVGVDLERHAPAADRQEVRRALNLPSGRPIVVTVGAVIHRKGYDLLAEAASIVVKAVPDVLFVWVGPATRDFAGVPGQETFFAGLERRIQAFGLGDHIRMVGESREVRAYLQAADVFVLPSRGEGLPNSVMEASAVELPVVMAALPGISTDLVEDGETGFVFPQEDVAALADRLLRLLSDPALCARFGRRGRHLMRERFEISKVADEYVALYRELAT